MSGEHDDGYFLRVVPFVDAEDDVQAPDEDDGYWCDCVTTELPGPAGQVVVVVHVGGQLDTASLPAVSEALAGAFERRPAHLVVDLAALAFCSARGLATFFDAGRRAAARGIGYSVSGASTQVRGLWTQLWPRNQVPAQFPTAAGAVVAAMARPLEPHRPPPAGRPVLGLVRDLDPFDGDTDQSLVEQARGGDAEAYRELARRHRRRVFRSALHTLAVSDDPDDVAGDIAVRLGAALAAMATATPDDAGNPDVRGGP